MKHYSIFLVIMALLSMTSCNRNGSKSNSDFNQEGIGVTTPEEYDPFEALVEFQKQFADETIIVVTHGQFARNLIAAHFNCNYHEVATFVNAEIRMLNI